MKLTADEVKDRMRHLEECLRERGIKVTHQRLEIFREVAQSGGHPDVERIYRGVRKRVPTVSLDTVYRTLLLLLDLGLLTTLGPPRDRARFDANMKTHHHFVCSKCGVTQDFYHEAFNQLKIPDRVQEWGRMERTQVEIKGTCEKCLRNIGKGSEKK
ncbi:MAG TPA: transcriptional repressor [bacterium]|nr:transcriptional repressor [bacterium]